MNDLVATCDISMKASSTNQDLQKTTENLVYCSFCNLYFETQKEYHLHCFGFLHKESLAIQQYGEDQKFDFLCDSLRNILDNEFDAEFAVHCGCTNGTCTSEIKDVSNTCYDVKPTEIINVGCEENQNFEDKLNHNFEEKPNFDDKSNHNFVDCYDNAGNKNEIKIPQSKQLVSKQKLKKKKNKKANNASHSSDHMDKIQGACKKRMGKKRSKKMNNASHSCDHEDKIQGVCKKRMGKKKSKKTNNVSNLCDHEDKKQEVCKKRMGKKGKSNCNDESQMSAQEKRNLKKKRCKCAQCAQGRAVRKLDKKFDGLKSLLSLRISRKLAKLQQIERKKEIK